MIGFKINKNDRLYLLSPDGIYVYDGEELILIHIIDKPINEQD